jgi:hypothetical protein
VTTVIHVPLGTKLFGNLGCQIVLSANLRGIGGVCDRTIGVYLAMVASITLPSRGRHQIEDTDVFVHVDFYLRAGQSGRVGFEF